MNQRKIGLGFAFAIALGIAAPALAQQALQWRVEDGGNGHWYSLTVLPSPVRQAEAQAIAVARGGHLLTACGSEFDFAIAATNALASAAWSGNGGPWIGLSRTGSQSWQWLDGSDCDFDRWDTKDGQPNGGGDAVVLLWSFHDNGVPQGLCHDHTDQAWSNSCLIEWSADCNADGIVDYGQILQGQLADTDSNGIPDICEVDPCPGDTNDSGVVNAVDISIILSAWGTDGGKFPRADANNDGTVDASDLAIVLAGWGPCPN